MHEDVLIQSMDTRDAFGVRGDWRLQLSKRSQEGRVPLFLLQWAGLNMLREWGIGALCSVQGMRDS